jgi:hypothetical protein
MCPRCPHQFHEHFDCGHRMLDLNHPGDTFCWCNGDRRQSQAAEVAVEIQNPAPEPVAGLPLTGV